MKAIIYESNSGSTKKYAEMLSARLGLPAYSLKQAGKQLPKGEKAVFLGWIFANKIQGLKKAAKRWDLVCAAGVGMNPPGKTYLEIIRNANPIDCPLFYLPGALYTDKLGWLQKKLISAILSDLEKQAKPETEDMIRVLRDGCDNVSEENLEQLAAFALGNL